MPGVIIVEAFGQAAAALTAYSLNPEEVEEVGANARRLIESRYNVRLLASDLQRHIIDLASG